MESTFSGEVVNEVPTGTVVIQYMGGLKNGITKFISAAGKIQTEIPYRDDKIHGQLRQYYENGEVMSMITYENGNQQGLMMTFFENGMKQLETNYDGGKIHGVYATYDEFGDKISETMYVNGLRHGKNVTYYPKSNGGGLYELSFYENGLLEGDKVLFYETGEILATVPYIKGKAQAYPKSFLKSGAEIQ
jgi:antitoxin component YwqK of YwqJK toxin-antitoxin module